nr:hypothetical protein BdHM001_18470 [Bdellovibrio sp. HM001]
MPGTENTQTVDNASGAANSQEESQNSASAHADRTSDNSESSDNGQDTDSNLDEGQGNEEQDQQDVGQKNRPNRLQKRFDKLTKRASDAEALAEYWRQRAEGKSHQESKPVESKQQASEAEPRPDDFDTNAEYIRAYTKWELKQEKLQSEKATAQAKAQEAQSKMQNEHNARLAEFKKTATDFDDVVADFAEEYGEFKAAPDVIEALMSSDLGPNILYKILKTPGEYERLQKLSVASAIREIGKIEAGIAAEKSSSQSINKTSKAPAPVSTVGGGGGALTKSLSDPNISFAEYEKIRMQQLKNKK